MNYLNLSTKKLNRNKKQNAKDARTPLREALDQKILRNGFYFCSIYMRVGGVWSGDMLHLMGLYLFLLVQIVLK
jgi:hypothetical protein